MDTDVRSKSTADVWRKNTLSLSLTSISTTTSVYYSSTRKLVTSIHKTVLEQLFKQRKLVYNHHHYIHYQC